MSLVESAHFQHAERHPSNLLCVSGAGAVQAASGAISVTDGLHLRRDCSSNASWKKKKKNKALWSKNERKQGYLVDVEIAAKDVKLSVKRLEETDDLHRSCRGTNGREADQVTKEHRHIVVTLRLDRFACANVIQDDISQQHPFERCQKHIKRKHINKRTNEQKPKREERLAKRTQPRTYVCHSVR